ncbi:DNA polymerase subunit Cdc27 [Lipomyces tetrasporus]
MANNQYSTFLATRIVHDQEPITYRLLSRELKVHTALAKRYLYAFHTSSRSLYPDKVHATYLISGQKRPTPAISGDVLMSDVSSPPSTLPDTDVTLDDEIVQRIFELVPEEELEDAKSAFRKIDYVHVYSLEPTRLHEDFITLAECGRRVRDTDLDEDPEAISKAYGTILEPAAKRQSGQPGQFASARPTRPATNVQTKSKAPLPKPEVKQEQALPAKQRPVSEPSTIPSTFALGGKNTSKNHRGRPTTTEDERSSDNIKKEIKKSESRDKKSASPFTKSVSAGSAIKRERTQKKSGSSTPQSSSQVSQELQSMFSSSEDEKEDKEDEKPIKSENETPKDVLGAIHDSFISDDIDLSIDRTPAKLEEEVKSEDVEMEPAPLLEEAGTELVEQPPQKRPHGRGRRKITKEIHTKDANGFLTTKYEDVWESYSELSDEETISASRPASTHSSAPLKKGSTGAGTPKEKDAAGKKDNGAKKKQTGGGQSSLMSFWKK